MRAMILAAGIGSRLKPLTDKCPKALIEIGGVPMLELVTERLKLAGVDAIVINTFHLADQIEAFLKVRRNLGILIEISRESELLDTGGGLKQVSSFFNDGLPFFLHNVDVLGDVDLARMYRYHQENKALVTVAVRKRESKRFLLFNAQGRLCGWESITGKQEWAGRQVSYFERLAFDGIHVISPEIFQKITETGAFSILEVYHRLAVEGEKIVAFRTDGSYWRDIGSIDKLKAARNEAGQGRTVG